MDAQHRLGLDINGVIISRDIRLAKKPVPIHLIPAVDFVFESIHQLVQKKFNPNDVYLISKSSGTKRSQTIQWLHQNRFYDRTGILRDHVYFCETRQDKAQLCERHRITHFVDDRLEVLSYLKNVPHLYLFQPSKEEIERFQPALSLVHRVDSWKQILDHILV